MEPYFTIDTTERSIVTKKDKVNNILYLGKAPYGSSASDPVWQIKKITDSETELSIQFANGNANYDNIWNNRVLLNYS